MRLDRRSKPEARRFLTPYSFLCLDRVSTNATHEIAHELAPPTHHDIVVYDSWPRAQPRPRIHLPRLLPDQPLSYSLEREDTDLKRHSASEMRREEPPSVLGESEAVRARRQRSPGSTMATPFGSTASDETALQGRRVLPRLPPGKKSVDGEGTNGHPHNLPDPHARTAMFSSSGRAYGRTRAALITREGGDDAYGQGE